MTRQQLIEDNMRLVNFTICRYYPWHKDNEDVIQTGMIGLIKAADGWDAERGAFSGYAVRRIRTEIQRFVRKYYVNQVPAVSLDAEVKPDEDGCSLLDLQVGSDDVEYLDVRPVYETLTPREKQVFDLLRLGMSQADIARELGLCRERVGQCTRKIRLKWDKTMRE